MPPKNLCSAYFIPIVMQEVAGKKCCGWLYKPYRKSEVIIVIISNLIFTRLLDILKPTFMSIPEMSK